MILDSAKIQAFLRPWQQTPEGEEHDGGNGMEHQGTAAVREEAQLILQILQHIQVMSSRDEVRRTFSRTTRERYLARALLEGGAAGKVDVPRMLVALRAAAAAGSAWAPLWLGDLECHGLDGSTEEDDAGSLHECSHNWYMQAAERGHPDAPHRIAALCADSSTGLRAYRRPAEQSAAAFRMFSRGGSIQARPSNGVVTAFAEGGGLHTGEHCSRPADANHSLVEGVNKDRDASTEAHQCLMKNVSLSMAASSDDMDEAAGLRECVLRPLKSRL